MQQSLTWNGQKAPGIGKFRKTDLNPKRFKCNILHNCLKTAWLDVFKYAPLIYDLKFHDVAETEDSHCYGSRKAEILHNRDHFTGAGPVGNVGCYQVINIVGQFPSICFSRLHIVPTPTISWITLLPTSCVKSHNRSQYICSHHCHCNKRDGLTHIPSLFFWRLWVITPNYYRLFWQHSLHLICFCSNMQHV